MEDLSIILEADGSDIGKYIEALYPLLDDFNSELIIINNDIDSIGIPYEHTICKFSGKYSEFKKFCFASSISRMVMIIEKGMEITLEHAYFIKTILKSLTENDYFNLTCNVKSYINKEETYFFIREYTIVYNRGIKGFEKKIGIALEDHSFIDIDKQSLKKNIEKFIEKKYYKELMLWIKNFILKMSIEFQDEFFVILEKIKNTMVYNDMLKIENMFLNEDWETVVNRNSALDKYINFLKLKKLCIDDKEKFYFEMEKSINNTCVTNKEIYYCWLLKELFIDKNAAVHFLKCFDKEIQKSFIYYLLCNDDYMQQIIFRFIVQNYNNITSGETHVYLNIIRAYIESMKDNSDLPEKKQDLLKAFDIYLDIVLNPLNKDFIEDYNEEKLANMFFQVRNLIEKCDLESAILTLEEICYNFPNKLKLIRYYIQKIRYLKRYHHYVLSICMIVKDEEKNLERCLLSIKPLIDSKLAEIIIIDTGSKDNTINIAKKYTNKIFSHPWTGDFSEARNYSILFADGEYIFILDADEEFKEAEINKIIDEFKCESYKNFNTFTLKLKSFTNNELTQYAVISQPRIFKNTGLFYYSSAVHNQPNYESPVKNLDVEILHYGYIMTEDIKEKKFQRTATLLKRQLESNPRSIYMRFQLSTSYAMHGDIKDALKQVEIYMKIIKEENMTDDTVLMYYNNAATIYINCLMFEEAEKICDDALKIKPEFIDFIYYKALISLHNGKYDTALIYINKYLSLIDDYYKLDIANDGRFTIYSLCYKQEIIKSYIDVNYRLKHYDECLLKINSLRDDNLLKNCLHEIIKAYIHTEKFADLVKFYKERIALSSCSGMKDIFKYFICYFMFKCESEKQKKLKEAFENVDIEFIKEIDIYLNTKKFDDKYEILYLINNYDFENCDFETAWDIIKKAMTIFLDYDVSQKSNAEEIRDIKKTAQLALIRAEKLMSNNIYDAEKIVDIFQKYMFLCSTLLKLGRLDLLDAKERLFIAKILDAFDELKLKNFEKAMSCLKDSCIYYENMKGLTELILEILKQEYCDKTEKDNNIKIEDERATKYISDLKSKIINTSKENQAEEILKLFKEYDKNEIYDSELYYAKALALLSQDNFDEAKTCILEGLNRYPFDYNLLNAFSIFYSLKHDYVKAVEFLSKAHMFWPDKKIYSTFIPKNNPNKNINSIKILHGTMDISNKTNALVKALKDKGVSSASFNYLTKNVGYSSDYVMDVNSFDRGDIIRIRSIDAASKLISKFDIFHFHYGTSLCFDHTDAKIINELGKKILMHFWGQEVRMHSEAVKLNPYIRLLNKTDEDKIKRMLEKMSNDISYCLVNDFEVYEYVKDYFENIWQINAMIDLNKYKPIYPKNDNDKFVIVHAPTFPDIKGTNYILNAVDELKRKYYIEFKLLQGIQHDKAFKIYEKADLIIDQLIIGSYGMFSIEAMALGKPVICWINDFMREKYPKELPIISANPDNIKEKIEYIINNKDMLNDLGIKGRHYVEKHHDINKEIDKLINLYQKLYN